MQPTAAATATIAALVCVKAALTFFFLPCLLGISPLRRPCPRCDAGSASREISGKASDLSNSSGRSQASELDAHRRAALGACASVRKLAGLKVNSEHDHRVAVLVGDKKEASRRIYGEIARSLA